MGTCLPAAGRIGQLFQLLSSNMLRVAFALTCLVAVSQAGAMEKIHRDINKFNNDVMCWGRENVLSYHAALKQACDQCMQFGNPNVKPANPFAQLNTFQTLPQPINNKWSKLAQFLNRNKRQAEGGLLETDESDVEEFLQNFVDWKGDLASKMGNLTCVMTKLNMLDSNLQVNMDLYTTTSWEQMDLSETQTPHGALSDPSWRQSVISGYTDCYQIAQNFPQQSLDRNPLYKMFGRHMVFFSCAKKMEEKACAAAQMDKYLKVIYGTDPSEMDWTRFGLPQNKYKQAALRTLVMYESASPEENFVGDFFFGKSDF